MQDRFEEHVPSGVVASVRPPAIVGIDCATVPKRVGLARAVPHGDGWRLVDARLGSRERPPETVVAAWLDEAPRTLLALDAPLGWPVALADALVAHRAGAPIRATPNALFRRSTDIAVHRRYGKLPLEVGADRIARTARAALGLLDALAVRRGSPIPLAWAPAAWRDADERAWPAAIEVYPAATVRAHGVAERGYGVPGGAARQRVARHLRSLLDVVDGLDLEALAPDAFDAVLCVVAGVDALTGAALSPDDDGSHGDHETPARATIEREGWIWVRR